MIKVQLTLTEEEAAILAGYGTTFGFNLAKTARFFLSKAAEKIVNTHAIPVFEMSELTEKNGLEALTQHRAGKTKEVMDIDAFFASV